MAIKQTKKLEVVDKFDVTRKVSTKQVDTAHVANTVKYEQHEATIVKTFVQYDTEVDTRSA